MILACMLNRNKVKTSEAQITKDKYLSNTQDDRLR